MGWARYITSVIIFAGFATLTLSNFNPSMCSGSLSEGGAMALPGTRVLLATQILVVKALRPQTPAPEG